MLVSDFHRQQRYSGVQRHSSNPTAFNNDAGRGDGHQSNEKVSGKHTEGAQAGSAGSAVQAGSAGSADRQGAGGREKIKVFKCRTLKGRQKHYCLGQQPHPTPPCSPRIMTSPAYALLIMYVLCSLLCARLTPWRRKRESGGKEEEEEEEAEAKCRSSTPSFNLACSNRSAQCCNRNAPAHIREAEGKEGVKSCTPKVLTSLFHSFCEGTVLLPRLAPPSKKRTPNASDDPGAC